MKLVQSEPVKIKGLSKRGDYYYYRPPQVGGARPKRIALRTKDFEKAVSMALSMRGQIAPDSGERLANYAERFLAAKRAEYRPRTFETVRNTLKQFREWAGDIRADQVTGETIEKWRDSMINKGMSRSGMVAYLRRVQSFFSWLKAKEHLAVNPFDAVKIPSLKMSKAVSYCTREQRDKLIDACDREDLRFVLMTGFFLGLRRLEIVEAVPGWFRTPGVVEITATEHCQLKDGERRLIHYGDRFAEFLEGYGFREPFMLRPDAKRGKANYRWDFRKPFDALTERCGLEWVTPHAMRRTFATLHIQAGTPLSTVADWLGDSYDVTFRHYSAFAPTNAHVKNLD